MKAAVAEPAASTASAAPAASPAVSSCAGVCGLAARAEADWSRRSVRDRLRILRGARHRLAGQSGQVAAAIAPTLARRTADTLVTELLPLLDACRFLEREAADILKPRRLGRRGRPLLLGGVVAEVHREPLGHVLIIGPANFPLFLPGAQALQALAAGNTVTWKPGAGGSAVAALVASALTAAGLPAGVLTITGESVEAAQRALAQGPDKVVFTGSARSGSAVLRTLAETATPAVVELSGADAIIVKPGADLELVARAVAFGLRLNGGAVCMSPRRLFATAATHQALQPLLTAALRDVPAVVLDATVADRLHAMLTEATSAGATLLGSFEPTAQRPLLVERATPGMAITRSDLFAPVLSLLELETMMHLPELYAQCPYALTVAIFCAPADERQVRRFVPRLKAGTVLINDIIAPTADPRVPFGGRGASGYGVTRGAEGLLEMTAIKTLLVRRGSARRHFAATTDADTPLFAAMIETLHGSSWAARWQALRRLLRAARRQAGSP